MYEILFIVCGGFERSGLVIVKGEGDKCSLEIINKENVGSMR